MGNHLSAVPAVGDTYLAAIAAHMIVFHGDGHHPLTFLVVVLAWHVEMSAPGETYVHIDRVAVAVHFPDARYGEVFPLRVVEVGAEEVGGSLVGILHPVKPPVAVQGKEIVGLGEPGYRALKEQGFIHENEVLDPERLYIQDIFRFEQTGMESYFEGEVKKNIVHGRFVATGWVPKCLEQLRAGGEVIDEKFFEKRVLLEV